MHVEMQLLSLAVAQGSMQPVLAWGISHEDFTTTAARHLFAYLCDYANTPGNGGGLPGFNNLATKFPSFTACHDTSMTVDALCQEVRTHRQRADIKKLILDTDRLLETDPSTLPALNHISDGVVRINTLVGGKQASRISSALQGRILEYHERAAGIFRNAIVWPWPELTDLVGGIRDTDYTIYYGRPKNKKTFVALYHALDVFFTQRKRVVLYSKEMPEDEIWDRCLCFLASVSYADFNLGKLLPDEVNRLLEAETNVQMVHAETLGQAEIICLSGREVPPGQDNVPWLSAMLQRYEADAVFIDGIYLMASHIKSKDMHERVGAISTAVRDMSLRLHIPVIATVQANRKADKSGLVSDFDEIGFSDAFGRDATAALRVVADRYEPKCNILLPGARKFKLDGFSIHAVPCSNFRWIGTLDEAGAAAAAAQEDALAEELQTKAAAPRRRKKGVRSPDTVPPPDGYFDGHSLGGDFG